MEEAKDYSSLVDLIVDFKGMVEPEEGTPIRLSLTWFPENPEFPEP